MNFTSIALAFLTAAIVSNAVGLASRRCSRPFQETGFVWSIALTLAIAIPIPLSSSLTDLIRAIRPREAIDWLSFLLLGLAMFQTLAISKPRWFWLWIALGAVSCVAIAARMLYGGVHFRAGTISWSGPAWSILWGGTISLLWFLGTRSGARLSWPMGITWLMTLGAISASLAMSGSIVYGAISGLIFVSSLFGWIGSAKLGTFAAVPATVLIGLGIAYAEMPFGVGGLLTSSLLLLSSGGHVTKKKLQTLLVVTAFGLSAASVVIVSRKFAMDTSSTNSGYDAYR